MAGHHDGVVLTMLGLWMAFNVVLVVALAALRRDTPPDDDDSACSPGGPVLTGAGASGDPRVGEA